MHIKLALLPSDYILWFIFIVLFLSIFYIRTKPHLCLPWQQVFQSHLSKICAFILCVYISIALLDSIHLITAQYQVKTVFDLLIQPLGENIEKTYSSPFAKATYLHLLGTDKIGNDVLYESLKSIRTGLIIGIFSTLSMLPFALIFGLISGYFQGIADDIIQYFYTTLSSIPSVLLISASVLVLQIYLSQHPDIFPTMQERADVRLLALCFILGITSWSTLCRLIRAETLKLREMEYVNAAKTLGVSHSKILIRHILPNLMHLILMTTVLDFSGLVLAEAVLSYVGVGVDPNTPSWGNMINASRLELARDPAVWWPLLAALIFMFILVLCANLLADQIRDAFDPTLSCKIPE